MAATAERTRNALTTNGNRGTIVSAVRAGRDGGAPGHGAVGPGRDAGATDAAIGPAGPRGDAGPGGAADGALGSNGNAPLVPGSEGAAGPGADGGARLARDRIATGPDSGAPRSDVADLLAAGRGDLNAADIAAAADAAGGGSADGSAPCS